MSEEVQYEYARVNTRISARANNWLDKRSAETGIPKSTLILLAVEDYIQQKTMVETMADFGEVVQRMEKLEKDIKRNERN